MANKPATTKKVILNRATLNLKEREALELILAKDPSAVTAPEREVLQARSMYLSSDEKEMFDIKVK